MSVRLRGRHLPDLRVAEAAGAQIGLHPLRDYKRHAGGRRRAVRLLVTVVTIVTVVCSLCRAGGGSLSKLNIWRNRLGMHLTVTTVTTVTGRR